MCNPSHVTHVFTLGEGETIPVAVRPPVVNVRVCHHETQGRARLLQGTTDIVIVHCYTGLSDNRLKRR